VRTVVRRVPGARRAKRFVRGMHYRWQLWRMAGPKLLEAFADRYPEALFVEIGSNDGDHHDHLRTFIQTRSWRGVMVEPVPYVYESLVRRYGHIEGVTLENAAIGAADGRLPFYHLRQATDEERDRLPYWYHGTGSFSREQVLRHEKDIRDVRERIVERDVTALTFDSLAEKHGLHDLDLLLTDTEGYDWEILKTVDLRRYRPRLAIYEHYHLSREDREACREHFRTAGYAILEEGFDTFCLRPDEDDALTRRFRRLRPAVRGVAAYEEQ
jgi:FkbM family methyltransferase